MAAKPSSILKKLHSHKKLLAAATVVIVIAALILNSRRIITKKGLKMPAEVANAISDEISKSIPALKSMEFMQKRQDGPKQEAKQA